MRVGVVIPTLHEAASVGNVVARVRDALPGARVLVVDDASSDGTVEAASAAGAQVRVRHGPRGLGAAYREGLAWARGLGCDVVCQLDADGSHDPASLVTLLNTLDGGADLAVGARWVPGGGVDGWSLRRQWLSRAGNAWARTWLGADLRDLTSGMKAWRGSTLDLLDLPSLRSEGYAFQVEATWRAVQAGARVVEVPITFTERACGRSKMRASIAWEAAWRIPTLRA